MDRLLDLMRPVTVLTAVGAIALALSAAARAADNGPRTLTNLAYVAHGSEAQRLDLYLPADAGPHPVIVYIHGGAWLAGDKGQIFLAKRMLDKGYAVASLNYRLSGEAIFPAQIEDCKAAVRWLRAYAGEYNLDAQRFVAWGESAGGHLAALLGTTGDTKKFDAGGNLKYSSAVQAVVDYFGPTDFQQMQAHALPGGIDHHSPQAPEALLVGGVITDHVDAVRNADPVTYITKKDPPFFVAHGRQEHLVPFNQSELLVAALQKAGVEVVFDPVDSVDHMFMGATEDQMKQIDDATDAFLAKVFPTK